ncbi:uncharacterized protein LOC124129923 [Haliotis rufescens]|uniref:uncharacterized protein LOC124129923 n=1 Tax=Haliotis rufescens TaxID=6454 RepID=UPI00201F912B|nr:uncharacterized protein LOC124129923 [Haliotis rufescens]
MWPNMISLSLLLAVALTSVIEEGLAVEEGAVAKPIMFVDVEVIKKPLSEEWSAEECAGDLDINGCIDKTEQKEATKNAPKAWKNKLNAMRKGRRKKWQQRMAKIREMVRDRQKGKINDGNKKTWAWKMLQAILKGKKTIAQVKATLGKKKLRRMKSEKSKGKRWASRMLLALLDGTKTISQVKETIRRQKLKKLQSQNEEEINEEKTVEEADLLEKLEGEECKGAADSEACTKEMAEINDGKKTTWAWKMLQAILKGNKTIAEVRGTVGKRKLRRMRSGKGKGKRWASRMLLALLDGTKTISQVKETIRKQKLKKLQSQNEEEINEEKTVEEADVLEKLEGEECKGAVDSEACTKEMAEINDGKKTTWAWKMLQAILKGNKTIAEVRGTVGKRKLRRMRSGKGKGKRWASRMLLALLDGTKTISQVKETIGKQKLKKLQSQNEEEINDEKTVEEADLLEKLEGEECKGAADSEACMKEMAEINDGKKTTWAWKMLQAILKGNKTIAEVRGTVSKQKLRRMRSGKGKGKRWASKMLLALLDGTKTISQVKETIGKQKLKKLQSQNEEEINEEKTVEEAVLLEKLEGEECKGAADSEACTKEMAEINDGKKTTWAWKMLQAILKGNKTIAEVRGTVGKQKLRRMRSGKGKGKRWALRMLLALLDGTKTISQVKETIGKQKLKKLQSQNEEEINEEKTVEEADLLEKLEGEECKGAADSEACTKEMAEINDGKKTTWAWKMLQAILKGNKTIAEVRGTVGKQKLRRMRSGKGKGKRWASKMLLALLDGTKTISQVKETIGKQKLKKLQSQNEEEINEEKTVEEAVLLEKLEGEECKGAADSEACTKEMAEINDGKKTTWAWKMLQAILKGNKTIAEVRGTVGKQKLRRMRSGKGKGKRWASRMLLALLDGTKTISQVKETIGKQKLKKLQSQNEEEINEEKTVEEADLLEKLEGEECKGAADSEACMKEMAEINDGKKTTWARKMLQAILKGNKTIAEVRGTVGKQKLRRMRSGKGKGKRWASKMLLALLDGTKTISQVKETIGKQKLKKLQSQNEEEINEEKTVEEAVLLEKLEGEECKGAADSEACTKEMAEINDGKKTTWAWKMLQAILKGNKTIAEVRGTVGKQKLRRMRSGKGKEKRWASRMLLALLDGTKTISQVEETIGKQKLKKLQSQNEEEINEEKTVEEADLLEKLEGEECKGAADSEACMKEMAEINDGKKTTWAWKMLQAILKGNKTIAEVRGTVGKQKLRRMRSGKGKRKRWALRMLLALLDGTKTISQVKETIGKQKLKKLQSQNEEEINEEKTVEEADLLEKLEGEECKGAADSEACMKEMAEINDGKKTTWAWKMLQAILKGNKTIAEVRGTVGKQKLRRMRSGKGKEKRWASRMLLALLDGTKTISQVKETIGKQKLKKLQSQNEEEINEEKTVEEADLLEKLEGEECKGAADSEACMKEMAEINDGKKTTWAWKMLQAILKGNKTIAEVRGTVGKQKLRRMRSGKGKRKRWALRMLLALLDGTKTISQVKETIGKQKLKKLQSQNEEEINEEKTVEEADLLEKLEGEECKGAADSEACMKEMAEINDGKKTTWAWKMLQAILKGNKTIAEVRGTVGKQKLRRMRSGKGKRKRWALRMLLALLDGTKTISQVKETIGKQKLKKLQSQNEEEINEEKTVEEADLLEKLEGEECKGAADSEACMKEMAEINDGKKTTWAWKMLQAILKGNKTIAEVRGTVGKQKLRRMRSGKGKGKRWASRMLLALLDGTKTISQVKETIGKQKLKKLQSQNEEEINEEKTVEEADLLEKLEGEECKGAADSEACMKEMAEINDGKKTTWAWKMLQAILKGNKTISEVRGTVGKRKLRRMMSGKGKEKRWASRMLLALLDGTKTISQVKETIGKQKLKKLQSQNEEEINKEKTVEEADLLEKLEGEECKGAADSEACTKEMAEINDGKKTTWAWKMLQAILKGTKTIAQVRRTVGKRKLRRMRSEKGKGKRWASRMLLALLDGTKTISQVRKLKVPSETGAERAEECKGASDIAACMKKLRKANGRKRPSLGGKFLQAIRNKIRPRQANYQDVS